MGALLQLAETAPSATHFDIAGVPKMESAFERQLRGLDPNDSFDLLGACSGVYLDGYGLVFTIPLSLIAPPPSFGPFTGGYTAQKAEAIHKRKLAHLPALRKALSDMLLEASRSFSGLPPNEKIAIAARLYYLDYEDKAGLPDQVVVSADRATALSGKIQTEEQ